MAFTFNLPITPSFSTPSFNNRKPTVSCSFSSQSLKVTLFSFFLLLPLQTKNSINLLLYLWVQCKRDYTSVMIVPTGTGAAIGGFAGDALPVARALSSVVDCLITHPNVMLSQLLSYPIYCFYLLLLVSIALLCFLVLCMNNMVFF